MFDGRGLERSREFGQQALDCEGVCIVTFCSGRAKQASNQVRKQTQRA